MTAATIAGEGKQHSISQRRTPINVLLTCTCGWRHQVSTRQNALARAAKVRAAIAKHFKDSDAEPAHP